MRRAVLIMMAAVLLLDLTGCTAVRQKFVRKKKAQEQPQMYLDLKEYPAVPERQVYQTYYAYVNGWLEEMIVQVEHGSNRKRMKKSVDQAADNMAQLASFYNDTGRMALKPLQEELDLLRADMHDPYFVRGMDLRRTADRVRDLKRAFMAGFDYDTALVWMRGGGENDAD